jgi:hypothetical protein
MKAAEAKTQRWKRPGWSAKARPQSRDETIEKARGGGGALTQGAGCASTGPSSRKDTDTGDKDKPRGRPQRRERPFGEEKGLAEAAGGWACIPDRSLNCLSPSVPSYISLGHAHLWSAFTAAPKPLPFP